MQLHIPTMFVMIMVTALAMALALAAIANKQHIDLRPWSLGLVLQVLAYGLYSLRGQIPDVVSIVVGNMAISGTVAMYAVGLLQFHQQPIALGVVLWPVALAGLGFYVWMGQFEARLLFGSLLLLGQNLFNIRLLLKFRRTTAGRGQYVLLAGGVLICLFMALRVVAVLSGWGVPQGVADSTVPQVGSFIATLISTLLLVVGVLMMSQERAEAAMVASEARHRKLIEAANEGICVLEGGRVRFVNPMVCEMLGRSEAAMIGAPFLEFVHPDDRDRALEIHRQRLLGQGDAQVAAIRLLGGRGVRWFNVSGVLFDWQGRPATLNFLTDITDRQAHDEQIRNLAFHDTLTHLPNRRLLLEHLTMAMARNERDGRRSAVVFMDLDNFKPLNDQHGHAAGDALLVEVAERLRQNIRSMDTAARFGGDEFVLLLNGLDADQAAALAQATQVVEKLLVALSAPYTLSAMQGGVLQAVVHRCTASMGLSMLAGAEKSAQAVLDEADAAMYQAKEAGRNCVKVFQSGATLAA